VNGRFAGTEEDVRMSGKRSGKTLKESQEV